MNKIFVQVPYSKQHEEEQYEAIRGYDSFLAEETKVYLPCGRRRKRADTWYKELDTL